MAVTKTLTNLMDAARSRTQRTVDPALVTADLTTWANEWIRSLWPFYAQLRPDDITARSSSFTISSGNTFTMASGGADGVTAAQFFDLRGVDISYDNGSHWLPIRAWRFADRGIIDRLRYRRRKTTLEILPSESATLYPYRYWYIQAPTVLVNGSDSIDLPIGGDRYIIEGMAAQTRAAFEEDPAPHIKAQEDALAEMIRWLRLSEQGEPEVVRAAQDGDDPGAF